MRKIFATFILLTSISLGVFAQAPMLNYQGKLLGTNGLPFNGMVQAAINVYTQSVGGSPVYSEAIGNVVVQDGLYSFNWGAAGTSFVEKVEQVAIANGSQSVFNFTVSSKPVKNGSVRITGGAFNWRDNGSGSSSPANFLGVVSDYSAGNMSAIFLSGPPSSGTVVSVAYTQIPLSYRSLSDYSAIEVVLDGEPLSPRYQMAVVPYAMHSFSAVETDPVWVAERSAYATGTPIYAEADPIWRASSNNVWSAISDKQVAGNYATGTPIYTESDPLWTVQKSSYATGTPLYAFTESDPAWNAAKAGYATGTPVYAESDPAWTGSSNSVWSAINSKQPAGNYATGMPIYTESDALSTDRLNKLDADLQAVYSLLAAMTATRWSTNTLSPGAFTQVEYFNSSNGIYGTVLSTTSSKGSDGINLNKYVVLTSVPQYSTSFSDPITHTINDKIKSIYFHVIGCPNCPGGNVQYTFYYQDGSSYYTQLVSNAYGFTVENPFPLKQVSTLYRDSAHSGGSLGVDETYLSYGQVSVVVKLQNHITNSRRFYLGYGLDAVGGNASVTWDLLDAQTNIVASADGIMAVNPTSSIHAIRLNATPLLSTNISKASVIKSISITGVQ